MTHHPKKASNVFTEHKIDGILILSASWNVWNPMKSPTIKLPLMVERQRITRAVKGSRLLYGHTDLYLIRLFEVRDVLLSLAFYSSEEFLPYQHLITLTTKSLESAVNSLPTCETYSRKRQRVEMFGTSRHKNIFFICLKDYFILGETFARKLNDQATRYSPNLRFVFLSSATGQSQLLEYFKIHELDLNTEFIKEVIYHIALDSQENGKYLLWSGNGLKSILQRPSQEYFPNCLGNFGNFYFQTNSTLESGEFVISVLKFYSKTHSFCHDNPIPPFQEPSASHLFLKAATSAFRKKTKVSLKRLQLDCERVGKEIDLLKRILEDFSTQPSATARLEAICSFTEFENIETGAVKCLQEVQRWKLISPATLFAVDGETLQMRCASIFEAYINLVKYHLERLLQMLSPESSTDFLTISLGELISLEAGEAAISFLLYGRSVKTSVSHGFSLDLCKDLGLLSNAYSSDETVYPSIGKNHLKVDENNRLCYYPSFNFIPHLNKKGFIESFDLCQILKLTAEIKNSHKRSNLCLIIVRIICHCVLIRFAKYKTGVPTIVKTNILIDQKESFPNRVIISAKNFAHFIFALDNVFFKFVPGIVWLRTVITQYLDNENIDILIKSLGNVLEEKLLQAETCLFFPVNVGKTLFIVTPIGKDHYENQIVELWSHALEIVLENKRKINKNNLKILLRNIKILGFKSFENVCLNSFLIAANSRELNIEKTQKLLQKYTYTIYE